MNEWVPTGFLTAFLILILKLWRDYHNLDKRISDIESEKKWRKEIREETLHEAVLESYKAGTKGDKG